MIEIILSLTPNLPRLTPNPTPLGDVATDDPRNSITKKAMDTAFIDFGVGIGITDIISNPTGTAHTIFTNLDHGLNRITSVSIMFQWSMDMVMERVL